MKNNLLNQIEKDVFLMEINNSHLSTQKREKMYVTTISRTFCLKVQNENCRMYINN